MKFHPASDVERRACDQADAFISAFCWLCVAAAGGSFVYLVWPWLERLVGGAA